MSKRLHLTGGENAHLFPVVWELGATIKADHVRSRLHRGFTAALSPFAGLGEANAFVPASEQSVKDLHNLLPEVAFDFEGLALISNLRHILGSPVDYRTAGPVPSSSVE